MKVLAAPYSFGTLESFDQYKLKQERIFSSLMRHKPDLVLFPEDTGDELLQLHQSREGDPREVLDRLLPNYLELFQNLARQNGCYICSGSIAVKDDSVWKNRSYLFSPEGEMSFTDKMMLVPEEIEQGYVAGDRLTVFDTPLGSFAIAVCYDVEFPLIVRALVENGANLILVPSHTTSWHGVHRVQVSCRARALENQCYVMQSSLIGHEAKGLCGIYTPIDIQFPEDGILSTSEDFVTTTLYFDRIETARTQGETNNFNQWQTMATPDQLNPVVKVSL